MIRNVMRGLVRRIRLIREYLYDYQRMVRYSSAVQWGNSREKLQSLIIIRYHGIEKGLSLPQPRPGFGRDKVAQLIAMLRTYIDSYGADHSTVTALNALDAYMEFNAKAGVQNESLRQSIDELTRRTGLDSARVAASMTMLAIKGLVAQQPGQVFALRRPAAAEGWPGD